MKNLNYVMQLPAFFLGGMLQAQFQFLSVPWGHRFEQGIFNVWWDDGQILLQYVKQLVYNLKRHSISSMVYTFTCVGAQVSDLLISPSSLTAMAFYCF